MKNITKVFIPSHQMKVKFYAVSFKYRYDIHKSKGKKMMKVDENDDEQVNKWEWNGWVGWIGTKESSVIERNDLFILFTDKKNINIFLCKQSYLHEQHTYIFRKYISLSLSLPRASSLAFPFSLSLLIHTKFACLGNPLLNFNNMKLKFSSIYTSNDVRILTARRAELLLRAGFQFKCNTKKS